MLKNNELLAPDMLNRIAIPGYLTGPHLNKVLNPEKIVSQPFWTYLSQPPIQQNKLMKVFTIPPYSLPSPSWSADTASASTCRNQTCPGATLW